MRVAILTPERAKALGVPFISPTAITAWLECPRKWAWRYIAKIYAAPKASAELGTDAHKQLELYLTKGMPLDFTRPSGAILQAGLHFFPAPMTDGLQGEGEFYLQSERTGFVYMGKKDVELPPGVPQPQLGFDGSAPIIEDLKTTKDIGEYAKSKDDLLFDPQSVMYAIEAMVRYGTENADLGWVYCQTAKTKKSEPVTLRMHKDHAVRLFDAVESVATEMQTARDGAVGRDPSEFIRSELPAVPSQCKAYGGCPHVANCKLSHSQKVRAQVSNSLIASLRNRVQGNAPVVTETPVPTPMPVQLSTPEPSALFGDPTKLPAPTEIPAAFRVDTKPVDPINPPESQLPPAPLPEKASAEDDKPKKERKPRAKKDETAPANHIGKHYTQENAPADAPGYRVGASDEVRKSTDAGFALYVDCLPEGVPVTKADILIDAANDIVVERQKATEEPVQHYSFLTYGKGRGALALALEEVLDNTKPSAVFCTATSDALPTLTKRASGIVRGVR